MSGQVILVVEDEVLIRMAVADELRDEGYQVSEAASGDEAIIILQSGQPLDLVITDVRMPGHIDGLYLTGLSKRLHPARPVVIVSAHLATQDAAPADAFIAKPYTFATLLGVVINLIGPPCQCDDQNRSA